MAVVKLKYIRNRAQIKAHLRYITHRAGESQEKITRPLFNETGLTEKQATYRMIDAAKRGTLFYKMMISPDGKREDAYKDLDLQSVTRRTVQAIEKRIGIRVRFVATVHNDHTLLRHVHGFFLISKRLTKEEFKSLALTARQGASLEARLQRKAQDRVRQHPRYRSLAQSVRLARQGRGVRPPRTQPACASCGYGEFTGIPSYLSHCPACHKRLRRERAERLELGVQT
jgi:hypothetical protein